MPKYINACKIPIILSTYQFSNPAPILEYNTTNYLDFLSDNNKKDISTKVSNNVENVVRQVNINNNEKDIRLTIIDK